MQDAITMAEMVWHGMEIMSAGTRPTVEECLGLVKEADLLVGIIARRYGWEPEGEKSITEMEYDVAGERRLFYVALTRAVEKLVVITDKGSESLSLNDIQSRLTISKINWKDFPPSRRQTNRLIVKVGNQKLKGGVPTYEIKDDLKAAGYQWQRTGWKGWVKSFPVEGFNIEMLKSEIWVTKANGIDIRVLERDDALAARYWVDGAGGNALSTVLSKSKSPIHALD